MNFSNAIQTLGNSALTALRQEYAKFVNLMAPRIAADRSGYFALCADGQRDAQTLKTYTEKLIAIDFEFLRRAA